MLSADPFARFRRLDVHRWLLLFRAAGLLTASSAALSVLPFRVAIRFGCGALGRRAVALDDCIWATEVAARHLPWRVVCIEKGVVAQRMLRASGVDAVLHYGARHDGEVGKLRAHVWVTVGGHPVIGGAEAEGFAELAAYP